MNNKEIKIGNIHVGNKQIPYDYLKTISWGLHEIAAMPPMNPTQVISDKYPNINGSSREIYLKVVPNGIMYIVEDRGQVSQKDFIIAINCKGYFINLKETEKKLTPVSDLERLAELMDISFGKDLIG